jgi:hypothetical protein
MGTENQDDWDHTKEHNVNHSTVWSVRVSSANINVIFPRQVHTLASCKIELAAIFCLSEKRTTNRAQLTNHLRRGPLLSTFFSLGKKEQTKRTIALPHDFIICRTQHFGTRVVAIWMNTSFVTASLQ